jgi:hypothetical protein
METDKEKLIKLFTEFGIGFTDNENCICTETGDSKNKGYYDFFTQFNFDNNGKFEDMGAFE